jgi:hypothetical protein
MESDFMMTLRSVSCGQVRDEKRVREILQLSRKRIADHRQKVRDAEDCLQQAEKAFLSGWSSEITEDL